MSHDVFICHSSKNKAIADAVCAKLEAAAIRCWIAPRDVVPGQEYGACIVEAIRNSRIMVFVFTADSNESPQVRKEVERAVGHGITIIPLRVEDVVPNQSLEYFIGNVHWLDALTPPLESHLRSLVSTINILLSRGNGADRLPQVERPVTSYAMSREKRPRFSQAIWLSIAALLIVGLFVVGWRYTSKLSVPAPASSPSSIPTERQPSSVPETAYPPASSTPKISGVASPRAGESRPAGSGVGGDRQNTESGYGGDWSGRPAKYTLDFGPSTGCRWRLWITDPILILRFSDAGELQDGSVQYVYNERWIQEPGKSCVSGVPEDSRNLLTLSGHRNVGPNIYATFNGTGAVDKTNPGAVASFEGKIDRASRIISGELRLSRNDLPPSEAAWVWDIRLKVTLTRGD